MARRTIIVTGDLIRHENLVPEAGAGNISVIPWDGGARRLASAIRAACHRMAGVHVIEPASDPSNRAYASWKQFPKSTKDEDKEKLVWRISQFLGTQRGVAAPPVIPKDVQSPTVLAIHDAGLGFREDKSTWPAGLRKNGNPTSIILNVQARFGGGPLWQELIARFSDRLTVVLPVAALRLRGAQISAALSWDHAIEDIASELEEGVSANDLALARRIVVTFGSEGAASFTRRPLDWELGGKVSKKARFERFLYDPERLEGDWASRHPGASWENSAVLAASLARHELDPAGFPLFLALGRGMAAIRALHVEGGGTGASLALPEFAPLRSIAQGVEDAKLFFTAFPHKILQHPVMKEQSAKESDLLQDITGAGEEMMLSKAMEVVFFGKETSLKAAPKIIVGKYYTVDREEIERFSGIRKLIGAYLGNTQDKRPLCLGVFGPPGSGKSHAVKQLAEAFGTDRLEPFEFNLSQFGPVDDLHRALHLIRNSAAKGRIPFVFWDEFDTDSLRWLKDFLAPMQDAAFDSGGRSYSIGRAVFVFAGGTSESLEEFSLPNRYPNFKSLKGPDFISRLRGCIDIKGPNPMSTADRSFMIRRALALRKAIETQAPQLLSPDTRHAAACPKLIAALLRAKKYEHGSRSLESLLSMSNLADSQFFGAAQLPAPRLIIMHVSKDFLGSYSGVQLKPQDVEILAEACHKAYRARRRKHGESVPTYQKLPDGYKESNRQSVRATIVQLGVLGYSLLESDKAKKPFALPDEHKEAFSHNEHDRWLREKLLAGWTYTTGKKDEARRVNPDILEFGKLSAKEKFFDTVPVATILKKLPKLGYDLKETK